MVLDSSAIVAVFLAQPGYADLLDQIEKAPVLAAGAPTVVETALVLSSRLDHDVFPEIQAFVSELRMEVVPFGPEHFAVAYQAFRRFGKGRHPAALNFGDCLTYAVAKVAGMPLLFTGEDFLKTDVLCPK